MADDTGFPRALTTLLIIGVFAVAAVVGLVMSSGRDPGAVAGGRAQPPWLEPVAPNT